MNKESLKWIKLVNAAITTFLGVSILYFLMLAIEKKVGFVLFDTETFDYLGWLSISFSTIFISTSLLGMLSDKSDTIYWVNVNEYSLVNPPWFNFFTLSTIGFITLAIETFASIANKPLLVFICFVLGIVTIIFIFYKMMGGKYSRILLKRRLERTFLKTLKKVPERMIEGEQTVSALKRNKKEEVNEFIESVYLMLCRATELACQDGKQETINENIFFFFQYLYDNKLQNITEEKLEYFLLILNKYEFLDKVIIYVWNEKNEIKNRKEKQYDIAIICAQNRDAKKVWDKYKQDYFWNAFDWKIDRIINIANDEYNHVLENENPSESDFFTQGFKQYRKVMCRISRILCINQASEEDMTTFLIHRIGEKLTDYEKKTFNLVFSEPEYQNNGKMYIYSEHMGSLCFLLEDHKVAGEGLKVYLSSLETIVKYPFYIKTKNVNKNIVPCFIIKSWMKRSLFNTLLNHIKIIGITNADDVSFEILDALVLDRFYDKKDICQCCLTELYRFYERKGMTIQRINFLEKLYDFISLWLDDFYNEIQSYTDCDEYEEYSNKINVQKDIIIWFTNTITNLITDEEEKRRFNTLRPDCVE